MSNTQGCDSIITLQLTILQSSFSNLNIIACDSYTLNGQTYTQSSTYFDIVTNSAGCDSVIILNLVIETVDNTVIQNDHVLISNQNNADYQWINCSDNQPIAGETNQAFTATANGQYAVIITSGTCTDTSACMTVITLQTPENKQVNALQVFPNPVADVVNIEITSGEVLSEIRLRNVAGQVVYQRQNIGTQAFSLDISSYNAGFFVECG